MIARDSDASKKFYRTVITLYAFRWKYSMVHGMKPSPAFQTGKGRRGSRILGRQSTSVGILEYSSRNTPVLLWKYSSTAPRVLEYFRRSTAVLWAKYSNSLPGSIFSPYSPHFQDRQGITAQPRQRIDYTVIIRSFYANAYCGFTLMCARYWNRHISRSSKLFYTIKRYYFHIESTFSGASVSLVLSHIARYVSSPEENSCIPITHFQCKNNFEDLLNRHLPWIRAIHLCASREDCSSWRIPFSFSYWRFCHISAEKLGHNRRKHYLCSCNCWKQVAFAPVAKLVDAPDLGSGGFGRVGSSPIRRTPQNAK